MKAVLLAAASVGLAAMFPASYLQDLTRWRAEHEAQLRAADGWLTVTGLFWLHEGSNVVGSDPLSDVVLPEGFPKRAGTLRMKASEVIFDPTAGKPVRMKAESPGSADAVQIGRLSMSIIRRVGRTAVRLRDPETSARRDFTGCRWFPANNWRIQAKWVPYPAPKTMRIVNVLGMTLNEASPGYAEFSLQGRSLRLEPILEGDQLFFLLKDFTSGKSTYAAGRYLYAAMPVAGTVLLDFNKTENPPCAFTAFATCPLPPAHNFMPVALEAGEMKYGKH